MNSVNTAACKPTFNQGSGKAEYGPFDVQTCGSEPVVSPDSSKLEYEFEIDVNAAADSGLQITYAYDHHYVVKCLYNREKDDLMASFEPLHALQDENSG